MAINIRQEFKLNTDKENDFPNGFIATIANHSGLVGQIEQSFDGIITGGIGSSAAAAVALVGMANKYRNLGMGLGEIAEMAWKVEVDKLGLYGGKQDQYCAAFGGINGMEFRENRVDVVPMSCEFADKLRPSLVLFHLGFNRKDPKIQEGFKKLSQSQIFYLSEIKKLVIEVAPHIGDGDIEAVGKLLHKSWDLKKKSNKGVGNEVFEAVYKKAQNLGAWGGKICGAGGGGYCIFMIDPNKRQGLIDNLGIKWVDFDISWDGLDTRIL
mgnify:FL=1